MRKTLGKPKLRNLCKIRSVKVIKRIKTENSQVGGDMTTKWILDRILEQKKSGKTGKICNLVNNNVPTLVF